MVADFDDGAFLVAVETAVVVVIGRDFEFDLKLKNILDETDTRDLKLLLDEIIENREPYLISHLEIDGETLQNLGFKGKKIGEVLSRLQEFVIFNPEHNQKEKLIEI